MKLKRIANRKARHNSKHELRQYKVACVLEWLYDNVWFD